ncbi:hypothetical protein N2152v2_007596 [Parachlorella kessleri]
MLPAQRQLAGGAEFKNRTGEFFAIVERLQQQQGIATSSGARQENGFVGGPTTSAAVPQSEFARRASKIGMGIHSTSQKLQKLAQLAKRTSMFDDPAQEINELSTVVKQDIQALNSAIADLQTLAAGGSNKQSADHSHTVIDNLRTRLKDATKEFKDVLTLRTENLKVHQERKTLFSATPDQVQPLFGQPGASFLPASSQQRNPFAAQVKGGLQGGEELNGAAATEQYVGPSPPSSSSSSSLPQAFGGGSGSGVAPVSPLPGPNAQAEAPWCRSPLLPQQSQQQLMLAAPQDTYLASRAQALHQVESTIVELGTIFQQLAHMVQEQGEMTMRIDENVEDALANVDAGQAQLLKYLNTISSNRWLIMKVFFVLMVFLVFFLVFIA